MTATATWHTSYGRRVGQWLSVDLVAQPVYSKRINVRMFPYGLTTAIFSGRVLGRMMWTCAAVPRSIEDKLLPEALQSRSQLIMFRWGGEYLNPLDIVVVLHATSLFPTCEKFIWACHCRLLSPPHTPISRVSSASQIRIQRIAVHNFGHENQLWRRLVILTTMSDKTTDPLNMNRIPFWRRSIIINVDRSVDLLMFLIVASAEEKGYVTVFGSFCLCSVVFMSAYQLDY